MRESTSLQGLDRTSVSKSSGIEICWRVIDESIDAEATGGGFPGWLQRIEGILRTNATDYLDATNKYAKYRHSSSNS